MYAGEYLFLQKDHGIVYARIFTGDDDIQDTFEHYSYKLSSDLWVFLDDFLQDKLTGKLEDMVCCPTWLF